MIQGGSRIGKDIPPYTLVGRDPITYCGINIVGLRRRGFTNQQVYLIQCAVVVLPTSKFI